ncbi:hypothetical protein OAN27_01175 [Pelagibacteraceae bacterium]|nr:hypothetical protein [Pelagibacteraceae bacterium]
MINKTKMFLFKLPGIKNILAKKNWLKFIFSLRYIVTIFILTFLIYLVSPKFFNQQKNLKFISSALLNSYNIELIDFTAVNYEFWPTPRLIFKEPKINFNNGTANSDLGELVINLSLSEIYNISEITLDKIHLKETKVFVAIDKVKNFVSYTNSLKDNIFFTQGSLTVLDNNEAIIKFYELKFDNKKKQELVFESILFNEKINIRFLKLKEKNKLKIKANSIGLNFIVNFNKISNLENYSGNAKIKFLKSNLKFDFKKKRILEIKNSYIRNNLFQGSFDGEIQISPFFVFNLFFDLKNINTNSIDKILLVKNPEKFLQLNKKLNGNIKLRYESKKINLDFVKKIEMSLKLENGLLEIVDSNLKFNGGSSKVVGTILNDEGNQKLKFDIILNLEDKKIFLKEFNLKNKKDNESVKLNINGSLNFTKNKISLNKIEISNKYKANSDELSYFENLITDYAINKNFLSLLDRKKLKVLIEEIY